MPHQPARHGAGQCAAAAESPDVIKTPFPGKLAQKPLYDGAGKGAFYYNEKDTSHDPGLHAGGSSGPDRLQSKRFRFLRQHEHEHGRQFIAEGQAGQNAAYRTGLGILTEASDQERAGKIDTIAAAVLLDARAGWQM